MTSPVTLQTINIISFLILFAVALFFFLYFQNFLALTLSLSGYSSHDISFLKMKIQTLGEMDHGQTSVLNFLSNKNYINDILKNTDTF